MRPSGFSAPDVPDPAGAIEGSCVPTFEPPTIRDAFTGWASDLLTKWRELDDVRSLTSGQLEALEKTLMGATEAICLLALGERTGDQLRMLGDEPGVADVWYGCRAWASGTDLSRMASLYDVRYRFSYVDPHYPTYNPTRLTPSDVGARLALDLASEATAASATRRLGGLTPPVLAHDAGDSACSLMSLDTVSHKRKSVGWRNNRLLEVRTVTPFQTPSPMRSPEGERGGYFDEPADESSDEEFVRWNGGADRGYYMSR
ncbi:hypothetical protein Q5752_005852 [Cryptotrichosporon argae]